MNYSIFQLQPRGNNPGHTRIATKRLVNIVCLRPFSKLFERIFKDIFKINNKKSFYCIILQNFAY